VEMAQMVWLHLYQAHQHTMPVAVVVAHFQFLGPMVLVAGQQQIEVAVPALILMAAQAL